MKQLPRSTANSSVSIGLYQSESQHWFLLHLTSCYTALQSSPT